MSRNIIQLSKHDQFKAFLLENLEFMIKKTNTKGNSNIIFKTLILKLIKQEPELAPNLANLKLITRQQDVIYLLDDHLKSFYIMILGTDLKKYTDISTLINKGLSRDFVKRDRIYKNYLDFKLEYLDYDFSVCGFSSSANIAEWIGSQDETISITSFSPSVLEFDLDKNTHHKNITRYQIKGDILSALSKSVENTRFQISPKNHTTYMEKIHYYHSLHHFTELISDFEIVNTQEQLTESLEYLEQDEKTLELIEKAQTKLNSIPIKKSKHPDKKMFNIMDKIYSDPLDLKPKDPLIKPVIKPIPSKFLNNIPSLKPPLPPSAFKPQGFGRSSSISLFNKYKQPNTIYSSSISPYSNPNSSYFINKTMNLNPAPYNPNGIKYQVHDDELFL